MLLDPLGPGGDRRFQQAVYDYRTEFGWERWFPVDAPSQSVTTAPADAVLLFDGVFLLRRELIDRWDLRIFVSAAFEETLDRARIREQAQGGSTTEVERRWRNRYIPGQRLYLEEADPHSTADIVIDNTDFHHPKVITSRIEGAY